jgi:hypothetical protein
MEKNYSVVEDTETLNIKGLEFDLAALKDIHKRRISSFGLMPGVQRIVTEDYRWLFYKDNGADLLAVAHLDGTMDANDPVVINHNEYGPVLLSTMVDDRLGAFTLLNLIEQLGIKADLLFTEGEEEGRSTAAFFDPLEKQYNWMFQFDRGGTDNVIYQYQDHNWIRALVDTFGAEIIDTGMMSDIGFLEHLGCQGVNLGTGYYNYTTPQAFALLNDLADNLHKFKTFYEINKNRQFYHNPKPTLELSPKQRMSVATDGLMTGHGLRKAGDPVFAFKSRKHSKKRHNRRHLL